MKTAPRKLAPRRAKTTHSSTDLLSLILSVVVLMTLALLGVDSVGNPESVAKVLGVHAYQFVIPVVLVCMMWRVVLGTFVSRSVRLFIFFLVVSGVLLTTALTIYESVTFTNAAYSLTRLNIDKLWLGVTMVGTLLVLFQPTEWWRQHWQKVVFWLPFVAYFCAVLTRFFPYDVFQQIVKEDHTIEYMQFWVLLWGAVGCWWSAIRLRRSKNVLWSLFFAASGLAFFLVAGDEVAWGQRMFGIEVGETVKQLNRQEEITVHNLHAVEWLVTYGYFFISFFATFTHWICEYIQPLRKYSKLVPSNLLFGFFLFPLIFYSGQVAVSTGIWHPWAEVAELSFYSGCVLWLLSLARKQLTGVYRVSSR